MHEKYSTSPKALSVAKRIKFLLQNALDNKISDPRIGYTTITDVRMSGDLQIAYIFYSVFYESGNKSSEQIGAHTNALKSAKGFFRSEVAKHTKLRIAPELHFISDELPGQSNQIEELLSEAKERDLKLHEARITQAEDEQTLESRYKKDPYSKNV
jgi:ribosome-binding factor A